MDGIYFNNYIYLDKTSVNKLTRQFNSIEKNLGENPNNFFVNTEGIKKLLSDFNKLK
jgi:hypothetical protein